MKRHLSILLTLTLTLSMWADKVYFVNDQNWSTVKIYCWTGDNGPRNAAWPGQAMTKENNMSCKGHDVWSINLSTVYKNLIFNCGSNSCQTGNLTMMLENPYWYQEESYPSLDSIENDIDPVAGVDYIPAVPDQCPDVMLQAFYWDSYNSSNREYGDTKWTTLSTQVNEIANYFSLIWLPPSSMSDGGMGYHPKQYGNLTSEFGNAMDLKNLIASFHDNNTKVLADIVINHASNRSSWCDFHMQSFGSYGNRQPKSSWICKNDEVNTDCPTECKGTATGAYDEGDNWSGARDWDHNNPEVREMFNLYLKWLKNSVGYDGWRYDVSLGYKNYRTYQYNAASEPYFSVMEYWVSDVNSVKKSIIRAKHNSLAFDFPLRAAALQGGFKNNTYSRLKNAGLRGQGYSKYAVTFIDNHDTFNRGANNAKDVDNKTDGSSINDASLILQANAYILAMPGVPCVFYPHWVKYKAEIKEMVKARWIAGVHSESTVTNEESGSNYYKATIVGKTGEIRLLLGAGSGYETTPAGYTRAYSGNNCGVYYKGTGAWPREGTTAIETIEQPAAQIQLHRDQPMFNILGQQVDASYKGIVIQNGHKFMLR